MRCSIPPSQPAKQLSVAMAALVLLTCASALAQSYKIEQNLIALKQGVVANQQKLAQYTWRETLTIKLNDEVKGTNVYQVQMGTDRRQQKTEIKDQPAAPSRQNRFLKKFAVGHADSDYQKYAHQVAALARQYTEPDPDRLNQAREHGNVSAQPPGNSIMNLVVRNYLKSGDSVSLSINYKTKQVLSVQVSSYLNDPKELVAISAQFEQLPDGTNHVTKILTNAPSKNITVVDQNSDYQKF